MPNCPKRPKIGLGQLKFTTISAYASKIMRDQMKREIFYVFLGDFMKILVLNTDCILL